MGSRVRWLKTHALLVGCIILTPILFAAFTWAEYGYFCDQGREHGDHGCQGFWSMAHLHDWIYNAASNWQSELLFGILLLVILKKIEGPDGADKDDT